MQVKVLQNAPRGHSAILSTFMRLAVVIKIFVLSILRWPFYTGFTVLTSILLLHIHMRASQSNKVSSESTKTKVQYLRGMVNLVKRHQYELKKYLYEKITSHQTV